MLGDACRLEAVGEHLVQGGLTAPGRVKRARRVLRRTRMSLPEPSSQ
jgi:hypothetical protein